jgi:hypothetical protein
MDELQAEHMAQTQRMINACIRTGHGHILNGARRLMIDGKITDAQARFATDYHTTMKQTEPTYARMCGLTREQRKAQTTR